MSMAPLLRPVVLVYRMAAGRRACSAAARAGRTAAPRGRAAMPVRSSSSVKTWRVPALNASWLTSRSSGRCPPPPAQLALPMKYSILGFLVGVVQRQEDVPGTQHRQVQHQRLDALLHLHRHARLRRQVRRTSRLAIIAVARSEVAPGVVQRRRAVGRLDGHLVQVGREGGAARRTGCRGSIAGTQSSFAPEVSPPRPNASSLLTNARRRRRRGWASRCPGRSRWRAGRATRAPSYLGAILSTMSPGRAQAPTGRTGWTP